MVYSEEEVKQIETALGAMEFTVHGVKKVIDFKKGEITDGEKFLIDSILILELYSYDVFALNKSFALSKSKFESKMTCRLLSMIMYEFMEDVLKILGKRFTENVPSLYKNFDAKMELKPFKTRVNIFKQKFQEEFKEVRNTVAAHRDEDPHKQLELINKIKLATFVESIQFFLSFNRDLYNYFMSLLSRYEQRAK